MTKIDLMFDVLTKDECDNIINYCSWKVERSKVLGDSESVISDWRTSKSLFIKNWELKEIEKLKNLLVKEYWIKSNQVESFCFLEYDENCEYKPHFDYFNPNNNNHNSHIKRWWNRIMTFLTYLSNDFEWWCVESIIHFVHRWKYPMNSFLKEIKYIAKWKEWWA